MKHAIVLITVLLFCSILLATPFEDFVKEAGSELADKFDTAIPLKVVLDNSDIKAQPAPGKAMMQGFIRELLDSALEQSETLKPIDVTKTDPILKGLAGTKRDYRYFDELGFRIHKDLNVIADALLEIKFTDLGETLKLELRLIDAITASELAIVKKEYPADNQSNQLLGKPLKEKPEPVQEKPEPVKEQPEPVKEEPKPAQEEPQAEPPVEENKTLLSEDFSGYEEGDPLPDWGKGVVVIKSPEGKKFVGSQIKGKREIGREIAIPEQAEISFSFSRVVENPSLILYDSSGSEIRVTLARNWRGYWVWISGSMAIQFECKDLNQFRCKRVGNTYKVYINGKYMLSGVFEEIKEITGFKLDLHQGQLYTNFEIKKL